MNVFQCVSVCAVVAISVATGACASYRQPSEVTAQMARTESSIKQAEQSGAQLGALPELQSAKDKFADAEKALQKKNKEGDALAISLAQQAQLDAQYAAAKAQSKQQQQSANEVRSGTDAVRDEAARDAR